MPEESAAQKAQNQAYRAFELLVADDRAVMDIAQAALLIAKIEQPELDITPYLIRLDIITQRVRALLARSASDEQPVQEAHGLDVLLAMNQVLFEEEDFRCQEGRCHLAEHILFNCVLDNRIGASAALSILYMEIGRRLGLHIDSIALLPDRIIAVCELPRHTTYIDLADEGRLLSERDCRRLVHHIRKTYLPHDLLKPINRRVMLIRLLTSLKYIYIYDEDFAHALSACDCLVLLKPRNGYELRERGLIYLQLKRYACARQDLLDYLELTPDANDRDEILDQIRDIRQMLALLN